LTPTTYNYSNKPDKTRPDSSMLQSRCDLKAKIQASKDQHKLDIQKAMSFDRSAINPPVIASASKFPRPSPGKVGGVTTDMRRDTGAGAKTTSYKV